MKNQLLIHKKYVSEYWKTVTCINYINHLHSITKHDRVISSTFYAKLLRAQILNAHKDSQVRSVFLHFGELCA